MYNNKTKKHKTRKKYTTKGGKVIASGGFGCVFDPALRCKGKKRIKNNVSKLMIERHVLSEFSEIESIQKVLRNIPKYQDYFLIKDFSKCEPEKLNAEDLKNFKKKCSALPKKDITEKNINDNLDKLLVLNMPHGGMPIDDYIYTIKDYKELIKLNNLLIDLMNHGIIPMNRENIYHTDVKDTNILISHDRTKTRLIDWGLTTEYESDKNEPFPKKWKNRSLQFNIPFSIILFSEKFLEQYTKYIEDGNKVTQKELRPFVENYFDYWMKARGLGHFKHINKIMYLLFIHDVKKNVSSKNIKSDLLVIEKDYTKPYIINYITEILVHFTKFRKDGSINLRVYLDTVFIKIIDIWGLILCYLPILDILFDNYNKLTATEVKLFNMIKSIILKYLYEPRIEPIDIDDLSRELGEINNLFKIQDDDNNNTSNDADNNNLIKNITSQSSTHSSNNSLMRNTSKIKTPIINPEINNNNITKKKRDRGFFM